MYFLTVRGETRIPSLISSSLAIHSSPHTGFSAAILRISARSSGGIGGRPRLHLNRQNNRHPARCQRTIVAGRTITTAFCQSNKRVSNARLIRATASMRRGLTPRSMYRASCFRRTKFSARIAEDERNRSRTSLKASESNPAIILASAWMRSSCHNPAGAVVATAQVRATPIIAHHSPRQAFFYLSTLDRRSKLRRVCG